jgi:hypothetical protein
VVSGSAGAPSIGTRQSVWLPARADDTITERPSRENTLPPPKLRSEVRRFGVPPAAGIIQKSPCGPHCGWK